MQEGQDCVSLKTISSQSNRAAMCSREKILIFFVLEKCNYGGLDIPALVNNLTRLHLVSQPLVDHFLLTFDRTRADRQNDIRQFLCRLIRIITFDEFLSTLKEAGFESIADSLTRERNARIAELPNSDNIDSEHLNKFYTTLKGLMSSDVLPDKENFLSYLMTKNTKIVLSGEPETKRQQALDKSAVITCLQIHMLTDNDNKEKILEQLKKRRPKCLNGNFVDFVYCISKCSFSADDEALYYLDEAKKISSFQCSPFEILLVYHTQALLNKAIFVQESTLECLHESNKACQIGMSCAVQEPWQVRQSWTRTFTVFSVLVLLRIGRRFAVMEGSGPTVKDREEAEFLLKTLWRDRENWDSRRDLMYQMCMARVVEERSLVQAAQYCDEAVRLSDEGTYNNIEKQNIKDYQTMLHT